MKTLLLILSILICIGTGFAQNQYYDAIELKNDVKEGKLILNDGHLPLLKHYFPSIASESVPDYISLLKDNPFFKSIRISYDSTIIKSFPESSEKDFFQKLGKVNVTGFTQGLSLFLIERAKEELNVAFFQKFKDFFENENHKEVRILFPVTTEKIGNLLAYQYPQLLPVLQEAFQRDMQSIAGNVINVLIMPEHFDSIKDQPEFLALFNLFSLLSQMNLNSPPELIKQLPSIAKFNKPTIDTLQGIQNLYTILKLTEITSNSVIAKPDDPEVSNNYWISFGEFSKNVLKDSITLKLYLGLLFQQVKIEQLKFNGNFLSQEISKKNIQQEIYWHTNLLSKVLKQFEVISISAADIKNNNQNGMTAETDNLYGYVSATLGLTEIGIEIATHFDQDINKDMHYISLVKNGNELIRNTYCKNYSLAIDNALTILDLINSSSGKKSALLIKPGIMKGIYTYGRFIGNVASAKEPADIEKAISSIALPTGSSSLKKYQHNNWAVNAYLGTCLFNRSDENSKSKTWNNHVGITAPIGINWTFASLRKCGSFSVFASLLDIGAVVDYQLTDSTNSSFDQKIYLENILSPGGYIVYGFGQNIPLALSFGAQYGPGLTNIGHDLKRPIWRWNLTLTVDIPMIYLNQGRRKGD